ncbi:MAG: hypothetical protein COB16_13010 [Rhodobacteraceae bacterium]|nr:MAG: hypothetical protein COB16_13010 [Paracoccaceae bacterium]
MYENTNLTKADLLQYWFDEIWSKGNLDVIDEMLGPETIANGLIPSFSLLPADYHDLVLALRSLVKDINVGFTHTLEQDDWIAVRTVINGNRADNDKPIQIFGQIFVRFDGQRLAEIYSHVNFFSLFEQLGQLPPDALPICLTGQRLQWT